MSLRTSFILMVLFLVLGTFAVFDPLRTKEKEEERRDRDSKVVWLKDKKLVGLSIKSDKGTVELECARAAEGCPFDSTGNWIMLSPVQDNADPATVGALAASLLNLSHNDKVELEAAPDAKEFGFDHPQVEVSLRLVGYKEPIRLTFGKASNVGPNVYLLASTTAKGVFLVPNYLVGMINREPFHWRSKRLFPAVEAGAISMLSWKGAKSGEVKAVRGKDSWSLERPKPVAASGTMLEGLASTLAYAAAKSIFSPSEQQPAPAKVALGKPEVEVDFTSNGKPYQLRLFSRAAAKPGAPKQMLARINDSPVIYEVEPGQFSRFQKDIVEYRRRTLLSDEERNQADELRFNFVKNHQDVVVRRAGGTWAYDPPNSLPKLSEQRILSFLDALRDSDFKTMHPLSKGGKEVAGFRSETPELKLEVKAAGKLLLQTSFTLFERKAALTESEGDVKALGELFLKVLPIRVEDLSQDPGKVVVENPEKGDEHGHSH